MTPEELAEVHRELEAMHAWRGWHWWPDADPFEVAVGAILVQNTSWTNAERAIDALRAAGALDPEAMGALGQEELEALVRPSGQYRQKARKLRAFLDLVRRHGGLEALLGMDPRSLREALLGTWGIGPETADAIAVYAARQPAVVVDAYTMRFFGRLGTGPVSEDYHEWQEWLAARLPGDRDALARFHALVVMHCKHLCRKRLPACGGCSLAERCTFARSNVRADDDSR
jgi:endonuclease-3 related protein